MLFQTEVPMDRVVIVSVLMFQLASSAVDQAQFEHLLRERNLVLSSEKKLTQYLIENYELVGRGGRPVVSTNMTTLVEFGLGLIQIDLDESEKVLTTSMWTRMKWQDQYLTWNPADFGGLTAARMEADLIWTPDIMLFNTADTENEARNALVMIFPDGSLSWVLHQIFRSSCSIDVANFPFDTQVCHMWFGSWTHRVHEIDLNFTFPAGIDLSTFQSDYKESSEWDIIRTEAIRFDQDNIAVLSFELHMERKMVFSSYILTLPCVFLACLTLVVFCLPPERPDRTGLAMSIFSSFLVLLLILVEAAPSSASSVPKLGIYYCFNMVIIMMSIFLSSMVVNIHRAGDGTKILPKWVDVVVLQCLGRLLCVCPDSCTKSKYKTRHNGTDAESKVLSSDFTPQQDSEHNDLLHPTLVTTNGGNNLDRLQMLEIWFSRMEVQLKNVKKSVMHIIKSVEKKEHDATTAKMVIRKWRRVAKVLDRLFVIVYFVSIVVSISMLFPRPPFLRGEEDD